MSTPEKEKKIENKKMKEPRLDRWGNLYSCYGGCKDGDCEYISPGGKCLAKSYCYYQMDSEGNW